jgi:hypothetical protein
MDKSQWAINLLRDDYFKEMMENLRGMELSKIIMSDYQDIDVREVAYMRLRVLDSIEEYIEGMASQKTIDEKRIKVF